MSDPKDDADHMKLGLTPPLEVVEAKFAVDSVMPPPMPLLCDCSEVLNYDAPSGCLVCPRCGVVPE